MKNITITNQDQDAFGVMLHALEDLMDIVQYGDVHKLEVLAPEIILRNRLIDSWCWLMLRDDCDVDQLVKEVMVGLYHNSEGFDCSLVRSDLLTKMIRLNTDMYGLRGFKYNVKKKEFIFTTDRGELVVPIEVGYIKKMSANSALLRDMFFVDANCLYKNGGIYTEEAVLEIVAKLMDNPQYSMIKAATVL